MCIVHACIIVYSTILYVTTSVNAPSLLLFYKRMKISTKTKLFARVFIALVAKYEK